MGNSQNREEQHLIRQVKEGNIYAFEQLVNIHKDILLSLACSILKDQALAEDVLQEAFFKVFKSIKSFQERSSFSTWVYRIVINTSYNALKKQEYNNRLKTIVAGDIPSIKEFKDTLQIEDQKKYIQLALTYLKADEALALRLYYLCELSISEIAEVTGFKKGKIKTDLHRGRIHFEQALRKLLGKEITLLL